MTVRVAKGTKGPIQNVFKRPWSERGPGGGGPEQQQQQQQQQHQQQQKRPTAHTSGPSEEVLMDCSGYPLSLKTYTLLESRYESSYESR